LKILKFTKKKPLISVIVNYYKGSEFLNEAIESVIKQTYKNWEIIFWDNDSKDHCLKIIKNFKDKRIKYFYSKTHTNLYAARNYALKKASGDFYAFLDADDLWFEEYLENQIKLFNNPKVGFSASNYYKFFQKNNKKSLMYNKELKEGYVFDDLINNYTVGLFMLMIRKKTLIQNNLKFNNNYEIIGDFDLVIRLSKISSLARSHEPLGICRIHNSNLTNKNFSKMCNELKHWFINFDIKILNPKYKNRIEQKINYLFCLRDLFFEKRIKCLINITNLNIGLLKFKLLIFFLIPKKILKKFYYIYE
jgi:glycosyltransferase involved in cell wall biosynthesis